MSDGTSGNEEVDRLISNTELRKRLVSALFDPESLCDDIAALGIDAQEVLSIVDDKHFQMFVRREWFIGRMHALAQEFQRCQAIGKVSNADIATRLNVARSAITHWYSGSTGISGENWLILQRRFPAVTSHCQQVPEWFMDLRGCIRVVGRLREGSSKHRYAEYPTMQQFFFLVAVFKNKEFSKALRSKQEAQIDLISRKCQLFARNATKVYSWNPLNVDSDVKMASSLDLDRKPGQQLAGSLIHEGDVDVQLTLEIFALYYYCTRTGLDDVCWPKTNAI